MRGNLWTLVVAAIGGGLLLRGAGAALPDNPQSSTSNLVGVFDVVAPFAGQLLTIAAFGALIILALRVK